MSVRVPLWVALALCVGSLALGSVFAQAQKPDAKGEKESRALEDAIPKAEYEYLPAQYSAPYIPSVAEWRALQVSQLSAGTPRISEQFSIQRITCFPTPKRLFVSLELLPQPGWKLYKGGGKFTGAPEKVKADLQQAVDGTLALIKGTFIPEIKPPDVTAQLHLQGETVASWEDGKLILESEKAAK